MSKDQPEQRPCAKDEAGAAIAAELSRALKGEEMTEVAERKGQCHTWTSLLPSD